MAEQSASSASTSSSSQSLPANDNSISLSVTATIPSNCDSDDGGPHKHQTRRSQRLRKIAKYAYVIGVVVLGFAFVAVKAWYDPFDEWLDGVQSDVVTFLTEDSMGYLWILLILFVITVCKSVGFKDILGLRFILVVLLSCRICEAMGSQSKGLTLVLCMLITGVLSSISKLIEYRVIGHELQVVQGMPTEIVLSALRRLLLLFPCVEEEQIEWVSSKYTFEISEKSRSDTSMHVIANFDAVLSQMQCWTRCVGAEETEDRDIDDDVDVESHERQCRSLTLRNVLLFVMAVIWTSCMEWVTPISELFMFAHSWDLSARNVAIIISSEIVDFDKIIEAYILIDGVNDSDLIDAKVTAVLSKPFFWAMGYCFMMPLTLLWAKRYHEKHIAKEDGRS